MEKLGWMIFGEIKNNENEINILKALKLDLEE